MSESGIKFSICNSVVHKYFGPPTNSILSTSTHTFKYLFKPIVYMLAVLPSSPYITVWISL